MKFKTRIVLGILIFLIGISFFIAPFVVNYLNTRISYEVIHGYDESISKRSKEKIDEQIAKAKAYNMTLSTGIIGEDPFTANSKKVSNDAKELSYPEGFEENQVIGEISVPKLDIRYPIYNGISDEILAKGIGYLPTTSLPVEGTSTHTVLTGHRGQANNIFFRYIDELEIGDLFYIKSLGQNLVYKVDQKKIVEPNRVEELVIFPEKEYATLLTCEPYMVNTHRLLIRGIRVPNDEVIQTNSISTYEKVEKNLFRYWWILAVIISVSLLFILALLLARRKNEKNTKNI